jgi:hypothetical protein
MGSIVGSPRGPELAHQPEYRSNYQQNEKNQHHQQRQPNQYEDRLPDNPYSLIHCYPRVHP